MQRKNSIKIAKKWLVYLIIFTILLFSGCGNTEKVLKEEEKGCGNTETLLKEEGKVDYTTFLNDLYENKSSNDEIVFSFSIKDLDNNGIPELVIKKNGTNITVYTFNNTVVEVGNIDFLTGTTRLFFTDNSPYPGMFYYYAGGGLDQYGYITIKDNKLMREKLWNEDYSGISKELGISRKRIEETSTDKQLIKESKKVYKENRDVPFQILEPSNFLPVAR